MAEQQTFKYEARNTQTSKFVEGTIKADSKQAVAEHLIRLNYIPLNITPQNAFQRDLKIGGGRVKVKDVAQFVRQLATMINAGIPLTKSIDVLRDQVVNPTFKTTIADVRKSIDTGSTLASAMQKHPTIFTPLVTAMIKAGETGGFLAETLVGVAETLEADVKLKGKIKSSMTYPVAILILAGLLITAMLLFIVPIFKNMFESLGGELPLPTQILVDLSNIIPIALPVLAVAIVVFNIWWRKNKFRPEIRKVIDPIKLKVPIFGKLNQKIAIARFTHNFGNLLAAGLPIMQVMDIVGSTSGNMVLEEAMAASKLGVSQGELIAPNLAKHKIFPRMLTEMLSVGEDAGEIPMMMKRIAVTYDEEVDAMTESLSSLMEPLMLMFLGGVVGGMVIALYMPIFNITTLISKS